MALKGTNQGYGRPCNRRLVLKAIRLHSSDVRDEPKGRGHPATSLTINPEGGLAIGAPSIRFGLLFAGEDRRSVLGPPMDRHTEAA